MPANPLASTPQDPLIQPEARPPQPFWVQLWDLTLIQLSNWRWSWRGALLTGVLTPLFSMVALSTFARGSSRQTFEYILAGNLVMSLMFENLGRVCSNFAYMKAVGTLNYFATLPVHRTSLILGTVLSFFTLSLPALAITLLFGRFLLDVPLHLSLLLLVVIPAISIPLSGIGALIGVYARLPEEAGSLSLLVTLVLLGMGPVVVPPDRLPGWMLILGWLSPASYAASALRQALIGPLTLRILLDLGVLLGLAAAVLWIVSRKMDWRLAR